MLFKIGVIPGDGIGPEVIAEGLAILGDVAQLEGFDYTLERFDLGGGRYLATGEV
ncbi:MAG: isocitrate/isopropylmalate family dehydrogenase, partial [Isosphaeraceae bacterium]